jgi:hypothetical protein
MPAISRAGVALFDGNGVPVGQQQIERAQWRSNIKGVAVRMSQQNDPSKQPH